MDKRLLFIAVSILAFSSLVLVFVNDFRLIGFAIKTDECASAHERFLDLSKSYDCDDNGEIVICQKSGDVISYERTDYFERWSLEEEKFTYYFDEGLCEVS